MSNLSFLVPTKNIEDFEQQKIVRIIKEHFSKYHYDEGDNMLSIRKNNIPPEQQDLITTIFFKQDCYILDYEQDIDYLENEDHGLTEKKSKYLISKLKELRELNPDLDNCLHFTYGGHYYFKEKFKIEAVLMKYFSGYLFDEGIHPEFQTFQNEM